MGSHEHDQTHPPGHNHDHDGTDKDPAEQEELARHLGEELSELFVRYVQGNLDFAELSFSAYDVLQDLHIIALGEYELEYDDEDAASEETSETGDTSSDYDRETATEQQEDLAQEPARS
ncbi:MAG: hypothetical protein H0V24_13320 [Chloroflexia bacterium]|nr:hypothetical protein [Chloroflexia bacterium]MDQ3412057.1 hypothetical protein [Chloroflexota bacterium]